jgi:hypothetical protein
MPHPLDAVPAGVRLHGGAADRGPIVLTDEELARIEAEADAVRAAELAARPAVPPAAPARPYRAEPPAPSPPR